jgi:hypothetical protein
MARDMHISLRPSAQECSMAQAQAVSDAGPDAETAEAADIVQKFLVASMIPDPQAAALHISDELKITFTGGRQYSHPRETAAFNAGRYKSTWNHCSAKRALRRF